MAFRALLTALILVPSVAAAGDFFTLKGHGGPIKGIDVSPDGSRILTASFDFSVGLWRDNRPVWLEAHRAAVNAVRFVDENRAVSAGDDFQLYLWDLRTGRSRHLGGHKNKVHALELSPDGRIVAAASWDGSIGLWPLDGGKPRFLKGHRSNVSDIAFTTDGGTLYSASADGTIRTWDPKRGTRKRFFLRHGFGINTLVLHDRTRWLAYGSLDGTVRVVDSISGERIADFTSSRTPILAMAADPGFTTLAVGDGEGFIKVIDTRSWSVRRNFRATLRGPVWALRFSADGRNIHAGGLDDAMYSWPVDLARPARANDPGGAHVPQETGEHDQRRTPVPAQVLDLPRARPEGAAPGRPDPVRDIRAPGRHARRLQLFADAPELGHRMERRHHRCPVRPGPGSLHSGFEDADAAYRQARRPGRPDRLSQARDGETGEYEMRTMLIAFLAMAVVAIGADILLDFIGYSTQAVTSGPAVRSG